MSGTTEERCRRWPHAGWICALLVGFVPHLFVVVPLMRAARRGLDPIVSGAGYVVFLEFTILPLTALVLVVALCLRRWNVAVGLAGGCVAGLAWVVGAGQALGAAVTS